MIDLPDTTLFKRRIPKQKFYENLNVTTAIKQAFIEQIKVIFWMNKIAPATTNISAGKTVNEVELFEIKLNTQTLDEAVLKLIDREIPYHIVFLLSYEKKYQLWIGYKEENGGKSAFQVSGYYHTEWQTEEEISLEIQGLDMDSVYENFVRQIAGDKLKAENSDESLKESVEREQQRQALKKQIENLTKAVRREKQFNKQMELNKELKKLKEQLAEY